jgi:N-methylhydantoinase A
MSNVTSIDRRGRLLGKAAASATLPPPVAARIGIDTGGTFTDVVRWTPKGLEVAKVPSTPRDPALAVLHGLARARRTPREAVDVVHGSTVGLNAVLTGSLARTAFVTNHGFEDLIEIGRQDRVDLYALEPSRTELPVPRPLRIGVACRRGPGGRVLEPLTQGAIDRVVQQLRRLRTEAVAIGLLHSPDAPADEQRLAAAIRRALPEVAVTASAALWPALGEFERYSATILNAAIAPVVSAYVRRLQRDLGPGQLRLMRSSLGIMPADEAAAFPARAMFSGPAGGVLASARIAEAIGLSAVAAFDMGGTSTDVCLVQRSGLLTDQGRIAGLPLPLPGVDVHTVGCGGGSLAYVDRGGALRVGPESAGADPGPACYGRGSEPTVTDAHMALGHLGADTLLGGAFPVDPGASVRAIERLARKLGLSPRRTAQGILQIAEANMARALMVITVERAVDPAGVTLLAYGGAGGLHAAGLCARLGMPMALVPEHPGAFSAVGLALAGESAEAADAVRIELTAKGERELRAIARALGQKTTSRLGGHAACRMEVEFSVRFRGQGQGLRIRSSSNRVLETFQKAHLARFGFLPEHTAAEATLVLARALRPGPRLPRPKNPQRTSIAPPFQKRPVPIGGTVKVFHRGSLSWGRVVRGPCSIEEMTGAIWLPDGTIGRVGPSGIEIRAAKGSTTD